MRIQMTFDFDERQRLALNRRIKRRSPMTRTELVQWISATIARELADAAAKLEAEEPDQRQMFMFVPTPEALADQPAANPQESPCST